MARGKPFICWLDYEGHTNDVPVYVGDLVEFAITDYKWIRGKIGYKRRGLLVVRCGKEEYPVWMRTQLRPILHIGFNGD